MLGDIRLGVGPRKEHLLSTLDLTRAHFSPLSHITPESQSRLNRARGLQGASQAAAARGVQSAKGGGSVRSTTLNANRACGVQSTSSSLLLPSLELSDTKVYEP